MEIQSVFIVNKRNFNKKAVSRYFYEPKIPDQERVSPRLFF